MKVLKSYLIFIEHENIKFEKRHIGLGSLEKVIVNRVYVMS